MYLHPSVTTIVFEKEESVISNISIPDVFPNNSCKCINNQHNLQKSINIYLPNDGKFGNLNIFCNSKIILNSFCYHKSNLYFLNIKHFENNFSVADNISLVQLKYRTYGLQDININTTQNVIKMKENYYKALINRIEDKLTDTEQELKNTTQELTNTKNVLQTNIETVSGNVNTLKITVGDNTDSIQEINDKIGEVKVEDDKVVPLQTQINTINEETIEKDETVELRKRIKELENYINANIPIVTIPMTSYYSSYLTFDEHVDARKRLWSLRCSTCNDPICKIEVDPYYERAIPTLAYNGTLDDLISKVNSDNIPVCKNSSCASRDIPHTLAAINQTDLFNFNNFIQTNNCVYTFQWCGTYDLYCNVCGIHFKSIDHGGNDLLDTGGKILNKLKDEKDNNITQCTNCNTTFTSTTFTPENTIKQSIINFYPYFNNKTAYCNFVKHDGTSNYVYIITNGYPEGGKYSDFTSNPETYIKAIKDNYIGKICTGGSSSSGSKVDTCGARWVGAIYIAQDGSWNYIDVADCPIKDW